jgi:perosamine synthetase
MIPRLHPSVGLADVIAALAGRHCAEDFEADFARLMGQAHALAFPYGRTGLIMLLEALGFKDREIILPAYTCVVVAHAIVLSGNRPVFIDSEPGGFNMDLEKACHAITDATAAIIATSIHGYPVDLDRLDKIAADHPRIVILQDCAHSFAASWKGRPVQRAGRAAIFGLNISKLITSIFGGIVTTDDAELAARLKAIRDMRIEAGGGRSLDRILYLAAALTALSPIAFEVVKRVSQTGLIDRFIRYYDEQQIDMPVDYLRGLGRAEGSLGVRQIASYGEIISRRRRIAAYYDAELAEIFPQSRPPLVDGATYSHYVLRVRDPDQLCSVALKHGIELGRVIDYCIPDMPAYREISAGQGPFDETRKLNAAVVNLPIWVGERGARQVVSTLRQLEIHKK